MRSAGMPIEELPGPPVSPSPAPRERAIIGKRLLKAGYLGEKTGPPSTDPEDMRLLFESVAGGFDASQAPSRDAPVGLPRAVSPFTWSWPTAPPVAPSRVEGADRSPYVPPRGLRGIMIGSGPAPPVAAAARLRGDVLWLWRARDMFPR